MLYDIPSETMPREELEALQLRRLKSMLEKVYYNVPFYQNKFNGAGVRPENIRSLDDIRRLPFTEKQDLRDNYPYGLFAVPRDNVVRVHASSGTTGKAGLCWATLALKKETPYLLVTLGAPLDNIYKPTKTQKADALKIYERVMPPLKNTEQPAGKN